MLTILMKIGIFHQLCFQIQFKNEKEEVFMSTINLRLKIQAIELSNVL